MSPQERATGTVTFVPGKYRDPVTLPRGTAKGDLVAAYRRESEGTSDFATMSRLRNAPEMGGHSREAFDDAVRSLVDADHAVAFAEENLKAIDERVRRDAIRIGGEDRHLLSIGRIRGERGDRPSTIVGSKDTFDPFPQATTPQERARQAIAQAYTNVMGRRTGEFRRNPYVTLADLRDELGGALPREDVDAELDRLIEHPGVRIQAELKQRALTDRDRKAAVDIGGELRHVISMEGFAEDRAAQQAASRGAKRARLEAMTLPQLRALARRAGLSSGGRKADLVGNLTAYQGPIDVMAGG